MRQVAEAAKGPRVYCATHHCSCASRTDLLLVCLSPLALRVLAALSHSPLSHTHPHSLTEYVTMVVTEFGMIPPSSVPVILREFSQSAQLEY